MVELSQCALPVCEVRGCQLVQSLQGHCCAIGVPHVRHPPQLPLIHEYGQRFLTCAARAHLKVTCKTEEVHYCGHFAR